jgi:alkanesulfonate monooxygenase SsuD/methylene tetrahydromethanopterin reductase-like flavin-dependent oxidoreductase (luciferase family)
MVVRDVPPDHVTRHVEPLVDVLDELWVVEDLEWAGGIAQAATLLERFPHTVVGHGIAPAPLRHPAALAMEWAALAARHPGRFHGGLGHGLPPWMAQLGLDVASPLTLLEETATAVRGLLAGERLQRRGRYVTADDIGLVFPPQVVPPVSLGVRGPRSLELSGRCADGTILAEWSSPAYVRWARAHIERGRLAAGREGHAHRVTVFCAVHVADTTAEARAALHDTAADVCRRPDKLRTIVPDGHGDGPPSVADILDVGAAVGERDVAVGHIRALYDAGADMVVLVPFGGEPAAVLARAVPAIASS